MVALAAVGVLLVAGCTSGGRSRPRLPKTTLAGCTVASQMPARCGYVWVPQDWANPDGPKMRLRVAVVPARAGHHAADPLFYLAGAGGQAAGYGDSILNGLDWAAQAFAPLNQTRDLVFVEQRGTPGSGLQTCPGLAPVPVPGPAAVRAAARRCLASARRDPRHDTTTSAARDLDQVRTALDYHVINLYGVSYGVTLGLAYLQRYSARVRTAVFDSGSLLNVPLEQLSPAHVQQAFGQWARQCAAVPACTRAYHPATDLATVLAHLKAHPARVTLPASTFTTSGQQTVTITVPLFLHIVAEDYLGSSLTAVLLPADLHALARGQWQRVIDRHGYTTDLLPAAGPISLQDITISCSDAWAAINPAKVRQQAGSVFTPAFTPAQATARQALCAIWPHDPGASGTVRSAVPVVFLNGAADPTDPPANVAAATRTMPHALLVPVPGTAHWVLNWTLNPGCLLANTTAFIQSGRPARPAAWAACTRTLAHQPPLFTSP
jgi:pimeloyl-ACP methyl ester carboxylesterase